MINAFCHCLVLIVLWPDQVFLVPSVCVCVCSGMRAHCVQLLPDNVTRHCYTWVVDQGSGELYSFYFPFMGMVCRHLFSEHCCALCCLFVSHQHCVCVYPWGTLSYGRQWGNPLVSLPWHLGAGGVQAPKTMLGGGLEKSFCDGRRLLAPKAQSGPTAILLEHFQMISVASDSIGSWS